MARASLSIPDTLFLFVVALVVFGPKRLPEIGKQIGKLVFEFRRASNDFKLQIEEELRLSERQEKEKQAAMQAAAQPALSSVSAPISESPAPAVAEKPELSVQPPSTGSPVEAERPNRSRTAEPATSEPAVEKTEAGLEQGLPTASPEESTAHHG